MLISDFDMQLIDVSGVIVKEKEERDTIFSTGTPKDTKKLSLSENSKKGLHRLHRSTDNETKSYTGADTANTDSLDNEKRINTDKSSGVTPLEIPTPLTADGEYEKISQLTENGMWFCKRTDGTFFERRIPQTNTDLAAIPAKDKPEGRVTA